MITLELTTRFLRDALEESYFGWDESRFKRQGEHQLQRAMGNSHWQNPLRTRASTLESSGSNPCDDIFHQRYGKSDNKLHYFARSFRFRDNWRLIAQKYLVQDFEVYLVDQRNHGRSFHHDEHNYVTLAQDVIDLLDSLAKPNYSVTPWAARLRCVCSDGRRPSRQVIVADIAPHRMPIPTPK